MKKEKNISSILLKTEGKENSVKNLESEFNSIKNPNFEHYYELANFYKDNEYFKKSIDNYLIALENINNEHPWYAKILYRIGTSFEKLDDWENAEKYLIKS